MKSSLACAGFRLLTIYDWVGKVTPEGKITAEADIREIAKLDDNAKGAPSRERDSNPPASKGNAPTKKKRPKLDLSAGQSKGKRRG